MIFLLLTCCTIVGVSNGQNWTSFKVGVLMVDRSQRNRFDIQRIGPAVDIAAEKCRSDYNVNLELLPGYYPKECSESMAIGKATDLTTKNNISAFLGPACSDDLQVVGRLASYKNIPILTGLGDILKKRDEFSTLIRMSYDVQDKAQAILAFLKHFNWLRFGIIYRFNDVYYENLADFIVNKVATQDFHITCHQQYLRAPNKTIISDLHTIMETMKTCSRVIVILGGDKDVREMMLIAHDLGMTASGEYAFLFPELIQDEAKGNQSWSRGEGTYEVKMKIKEAYQSLLIVSLNQPYSPEYMKFSEEVKELALKNYNMTYKEDVVNYFTASFHDAVLILCDVINETEKMGKDPMDASIIIPKLRDKRFNGMHNRRTVDFYFWKSLLFLLRWNS